MNSSTKISHRNQCQRFFFNFFTVAIAAQKTGLNMTRCDIFFQSKIQKNQSGINLVISFITINTKD